MFEREKRCYVNSQGLAEITYYTQPFESACFNNKTFEVTGWNAKDFPTAFRGLITKEQLTFGDLLYTRVPATDVQRIKQLEEVGFYFVECSLGASLSLDKWERGRFRATPTYPADDDSIDDVLAIAATTFTELRFNRDPHISDEVAGRRYLTWVENAYRDKQIIRYIMAKGEIAGFSLLRDLGDKTVIWNQAGLKSEYKGTGLGMILYASMISWCKDEGFEQILGGFSAANLSVFNVHAALGFRFVNPIIVLHYYVQNQR